MSDQARQAGGPADATAGEKSDAADEALKGEIVDEGHDPGTGHAGARTTTHAASGIARPRG